MHISNFELDIEEKILSRGERYLADGMVADIWSEIPNYYQAVVEGTITYDVEIHLNPDGTVLHHCCDCPYDFGEYCKHEVAVFYAIRRFLEQDTIPKRQGQKQGLRALLLKKSKNELVGLLYDLLREYNLREDMFYRLKGTGDDWEDSI